MIAPLTPNPSASILSIPCSRKVEFCSSRRLGDNTPQLKAVFLRLPVLNFHEFMKVHVIMAVLFGQPSRLVAPSRDSANSLNTATQCFAALSVGFTTIKTWYYCMTNPTNEAHNAPTQNTIQNIYSEYLAANLTSEDITILGYLSNLPNAFKRSMIALLEIQTGIHKPANDDVFSFQRHAPTQHKSITVCDKLDVFLMQLDDAYKRIENTENGLFCNLTPERYRALKARLSGIIEQ